MCSRFRLGKGCPQVIPGTPGFLEFHFSSTCKLLEVFVVVFCVCITKAFFKLNRI